VGKEAKISLQVTAFAPIGVMRPAGSELSSGAVGHGKTPGTSRKLRQAQGGKRKKEPAFARKKISP